MSYKNINDMRAEINKHIEEICCIYPSVGKSLYMEPRDRLIGKIARWIEENFDRKKDQLAD